MDSGTVQWSNLPKDLLAMIAKRLDTRTDLLRLRAVCSPWRSSLISLPILSPPLSSIKLPFPIAPNPALHPKRRGYFTLSESTVYYIEPLLKNPDASTSSSSSSSKGWLIKVREENPGKMRLMDPFSKIFVNLPRKSLPKVLNILNFRITEVKKGYNLQFANLGKNLEISFNELKSLNSKKVAMSLSFSGTGVVNDYAIMTIHTGAKLGYFKLGDEKWTAFDDGQQRSCYDDVVYYKGHFYALDLKGRVLVIDSSSLKFSEIESPTSLGGLEYGGQFKYLVESFGDLFLVDRFVDADPEVYLGEEGEFYVSEDDYNPDYPIRFKVYKFNDEEKLWVPVKTLGDRAFFVGDDYSFSVSVRDFPTFKENCIYFTEDCFSDENDDQPGFDAGIFDLKDGSVGPLSSFPGYSKILWPPPAWLRSKPSSSRC